MAAEVVLVDKMERQAAQAVVVERMVALAVSVLQDKVPMVAQHCQLTVVLRVVVVVPVELAELEQTHKVVRQEMAC